MINQAGNLEVYEIGTAVTLADDREPSNQMVNETDSNTDRSVQILRGAKTGLWATRILVIELTVLLIGAIIWVARSLSVI